jgi:hypothetical protein
MTKKLVKKASAAPQESAVRRVLAKLKGVEKCGAGWSAKCPAHDDERASLTVSEGKGGRVLVRCHAGCPAEEVVAALDLDMRDLFAKGRARRSREIECVYNYLDESGDALLYQVVRFQPKDFRQRRPVGPGEWCWELNGVRRVPYNLSALAPMREEIAGLGAVVMVVEGEKAAEAVGALGLPVTCSPGGAGKWGEMDEAAVKAALAGVDVVVLPDQDDAGRKHAEDVAARLAGIAKSVRILALPGLGEKEDPYDWIAARREAGKNDGAIKRQLLRLADKAPETKGEAPASKTEHAAVLALKDPEPWLRSVDGAALLDRLVIRLRRFMILPEHAAETLALWALHTYCIDAADVAPRVALISPTRRCGKSRLLGLLGMVARRALAASSASAATIYRLIDRVQPTFLLDEADNFIHAEKVELLGILNSGHTRSAAFVLRCDGEAREPRAFSTWAAMAFALIGKLPDTLADRSIEVPMARRERRESIARLRGARRRKLQCLLADWRRKAFRWAKDYLEELKRLEPAIPDSLDDRAADNWEPLLAIADQVGGAWPERARQAALALSAERIEDEDRGVELLRDIREVFRAKKVKEILTRDLIAGLIAKAERPWRRYNRGEPLHASQLARLLRPFHIQSRSVHSSEGKERRTVKGYLRQQFEEAWNRYLSPKNP